MPELRNCFAIVFFDIFKITEDKEKRPWSMIKGKEVLTNTQVSAIPWYGNYHLRDLQEKKKNGGEH